MCLAIGDRKTWTEFPSASPDQVRQVTLRENASSFVHASSIIADRSWLTKYPSLDGWNTRDRPADPCEP